jgi:hypothetical protein
MRFLDGLPVLLLGPHVAILSKVAHLLPVKHVQLATCVREKVHAFSMCLLKCTKVCQSPISKTYERLSFDVAKQTYRQLETGKTF